MKPGRYLISLATALVIGALTGCATPSQRFDQRASELGFSRHTVAGSEFEHAVYTAPQGPAPLLHVYLEGDASPRMAHRYSPADPTPHRPLMLELMALDPAPSVLLGRPCQHGLDPDCDPDLWTVGRYGERVVASLTAALQREREQSRASGVVLVGYSGGGALALLIAERVPETRAVVTLAGNLDLARWSEHHAYIPLSRSLDPATRPPLQGGIVQIHLLAGHDERVPPALTKASIARQPGATTRTYPEFDHSCCWETIWPAVLEDLAKALAERAKTPPNRPQGAARSAGQARYAAEGQRKHGQKSGQGPDAHRIGAPAPVPSRPPATPAGLILGCPAPQRQSARSRLRTGALFSEFFKSFKGTEGHPPKGRPSVS